MSSRATREHCYLLRFFTALKRLRDPDPNRPYPCTSLSITKNAVTKPHTDDNLGTSLVMCLGDLCEGGRLFVEMDGLVADSPGPHDQDEDHTIEVDDEIPRGSYKPVQKGDAVDGKFLVTHRHFREFNANYVHFTEPFAGTRYALSFFTVRGVEQDKTKQDFLKELSVAGLRYPSQTEIQFLKSSKNSMKTYRQKCFPGKAKAANAEVEVSECAGDENVVEDPAVLKSLQKKATKLLGITSNAHDSTKELKNETHSMRLAVKKLSSQVTKARIQRLLDEMLRPKTSEHPDGTFLAKTAGTWRVFVVEVLLLLQLPDEEGSGFTRLFSGLLSYFFGFYCITMKPNKCIPFSQGFPNSLVKVFALDLDGHGKRVLAALGSCVDG